MRYLLDTDTCSYLAKQERKIWAKFQSLMYSEAWGISSLTAYELRKGTIVKGAGPWSGNVQEFLDLAQVIPFDLAAARTSAAVSSRLREIGKPSGPMDELIAGHAMSLGATLVTNNIKHFENVAGLKIETWA